MQSCTKTLMKKRQVLILPYQQLISKTRPKQQSYPINISMFYIGVTHFLTIVGSVLILITRAMITKPLNTVRKSCQPQNRNIKSDMSLEATVRTVTMVLQGLQTLSKNTHTGVEADTLFFV